jgi:hypothetical protein
MVVENILFSSPSPGEDTTFEREGFQVKGGRTKNWVVHIVPIGLIIMQKLGRWNALT